MGSLSKFISVKTIIASIARTFRPTGSSWIIDAIEDTGWAIQAIGYHGGFEKKQTPPPYLTVKNHRALIPCDVERIIAVEQLLPDNSNQNTLNPDGTNADVEYDESCNYRGVRMLLGSDLTGYGLSQDNLRTTNVSPSAPYYNLNVDYVITSFSEGLIKLHYIGFALDKDGYPKILDDADYKLAIEWWIVSRMILKGYKHPEVDFKTAFQMYEMYRLRAENAIKVLRLDSAERFQNTWSRIGSYGHFSNDFFMNMEQRTSFDR